MFGNNNNNNNKTTSKQNPLFAAVNKVSNVFGRGTSTESSTAAASSSEDHPQRKYRSDDEEDDVDEEDEEDLSKYLQSMDIDRDFATLLRQSTTSTVSAITPPQQEQLHGRGVLSTHEKEPEEDHDDHSSTLWTTHWQGRDEIYSPNYRPSNMEEQEVQQLATSLGIYSKSSSPLASVQNFVASALSSPTNPKSSSPRPDSSTTISSTEQVLSILLSVDGQQQPHAGMGRSIILQRGAVIWQEEASSFSQQQQQQQGVVPREWIVMTHGFLLVDHNTVDVQSACCADLSTSAVPGIGLLTTALPKLPQWNTTNNKDSTAEGGGDVGTSTPPSTTNTTTGGSGIAEVAHLWNQVTLVQAGPQDAKSLILHIQDELIYTLTCRSHPQQQAWLNVLETVVIQAYLRFVVPANKVATRNHPNNDSDSDDSDSDEDEEDETWSLGWQHRIIQRSLHSPAVTGHVHVLQQMLLQHASSADGLNALDIYQSWSPLHYAAYYNHVTIAKLLLQAGADANIVEGSSTTTTTSSTIGSRTSTTTTTKPNHEHGRTPLYLAERYRFTDMKKLLESHGARPSAMARDEERGALFRSVAAVEEKKKSNKLKQEQAAAAAAAQRQQQHAMQALHERGQRIERLDDKTQELQQNAQDYRDMAKTLKDQTMQKKWYQL